MKRIKKYQGGSYFRLPSLSSEFQTGAALKVPYINTQLQQYITNTGIFSAPIPTSSKVKDNTLKDTVSNIGSSIIGKASDAVSDKIFGDSELGRNLGTIFSSGLNSVGDTILNNAIKKAALTDGLTKNLGSSVGGAVAGLGANYLGRGITSILGNNAASRFLGQSASTVGGTIGGKILSSGTKNLFSGLGSINPIGLGMSAVGAGLSAATGPSKEYNGTYGSTTKALDTVYDALQAGINFVPGWGQIASGAMALNKGLSNIFGSTDGMTTQDAILGSAFMPAPIKWLNMLGSSKTGTFNKQSWQNTQKTSNFMQNAFGDLEDKFSKAREEAGKTYGTFSQGAKKRAQNNIDFSNFAWNKILNMADQNEYQNIRSSDMTSINNQRYAQWIQGGFSPLARGKQGMKILNNSINHNLGQRLLSGAALIDSKQMILSAQNGTKIKKKGIKSGINVDYYDPNNVMSVVANNPNKTIVLDEQTIKPNARQRLGYYMKNAPAADIDKVMLGTLALGSAPIAAQAAIPNVSTLGDYIAGTKLVNVGNKVITNPYVSSAIESAFAGHGLNHAVNEGINGYGDAATTAMELIPLGRLAKPIYEGFVRPGIRLFNSPLTGKWTKIGNKEYRLNPSVLGANGSRLESKPVEFKNRSQLGKYFGEGSEQTVYDIGDGYLHKVYEQGDLYDKKSLEDFVERFLKNRNSIKLQEPIQYLGYLKEPNIYGQVNYFPVFKQKKLQSIRMPNKEFDQKIREWLQKNNYNDVVEEGVFTNGEHTLIDVSPDNIGYSNGELRFFDVAKEESKASVPQITAENASKITPRITVENATSITPKQWTAAQDAAIARGDMKEARRLKKLYDKVSAKKANRSLYSNLRHDTNSDIWNVFDESKFGSATDDGWFGKGLYLTANPKQIVKGNNHMRLNVFMKKPFFVDKNGDPDRWTVARNFNRGKTYDDWIKENSFSEKEIEDFFSEFKNNPFGITESKEATHLKKDIVRENKLRKLFDEMNSSDGVIVSTPKVNLDEVVAPNGRFIKSADVVTYDDNGIRIGLGERNNFSINDNRYSWLPWFLGGSTAATLYNKSK